jgi:LDH2 family malate/lactate/ureidoglycolate dehydrogenase
MPSKSSPAGDGAIIQAAELESWTAAILAETGASRAAAEATAKALVDANLRGLDSHGVVFLAYYLPRLRAGSTRGDIEPELVVDLPAAAVLDGRDGLGAYIAAYAMDLCCTKAKAVGAAVVGVRNSSHFGAASAYSEQAARSGCIGMSFSNSDPGMGPVGALRPVLGTNPLAIAAPAPQGAAMPSLDIATSVVAQGKVVLAKLAGDPIPEGWAIGRDGAPTTDPAEALANSVLPFAGHKGFAIAFMLDVLTGCLTGAETSPHIPGDPQDPRPQRTGHLFVAIDVEAFTGREAYATSLGDLIEQVHDAPRATWADPFLMPGDLEARARATRTEQGIPLTPATAALLRELGADYDVAFPA